MDEATADIVSSLQHDDLTRLLDSRGESNPSATPSNYHLALTTYRDELAGRLELQRDRRMSRSIAIAVAADQGPLATARNEERVAIEDQAIARRLDQEINQEYAQAPTRPLPPAFVDPTDGIGDYVLDRLARFNSFKPVVIDQTTGAEPQQKAMTALIQKTQAPAALSETELNGGEVDPSGQSQQAAGSSLKRKAEDSGNGVTDEATKVPKLDPPQPPTVPPKRTIEGGDELNSETSSEQARNDILGNSIGLDNPDCGVKKTCTSCSESVSYFAAVYAPCGHDYCSECTKRLFVMHTNDESLFPPQCCGQTIPLAAVDVFLTAEFVQYFQAKSLEYSTLDRTYCARPSCSAFIPPSTINGDSAMCPECSSWVCALCKQASHAGRECPTDTALDELVAKAKEVGWQRCYKCKQYVELIHGCNHIMYVIPLPASLQRY
ncbi:MAG: hypothetical protein LQ338_000169 [Usnochroma carphineum]|nr:MAG: hypothetical protein LQ338_000169 [Usnochroma carphineum]